jgi:hypothetical protein
LAWPYLSFKKAGFDSKELFYALFKPVFKALYHLFHIVTMGDPIS